MGNPYRGVPGGSRNAVIDAIKSGPVTAEAIASSLELSGQTVWLIIKKLRDDGKPVRIADWVKPKSGVSLVPVYAWEQGYDADKPLPHSPPEVAKTPSLPHRDWPVVALFGERGMANNKMEKRA